MYGPNVRSFEIDVASGVTLSSALKLGGHAWDHIYLEIATHASGGYHYIHASDAEDGNFHRIHVVDPATGGDNLVAVLAPNGKLVKLCGGLSYVKVEVQSGVTDTTMTYKFYCS